MINRDRPWLEFMASYRLFFSLFSEGVEGMVAMCATSNMHHRAFLLKLQGESILLMLNDKNGRGS